MTESDLAYLARWFERHCDGDWEHDLGIRIETLDNPGWAVNIRIEDTELEGQVVEWQRTDLSDDRWVHWRATGVMFEVRCGPGDLGKALEIFRTFAESSRDGR